MLGNARLQLSELLNSLSKESNQRTASAHSVPSLFEIMEQIERRVIVDMLEQTGWNQTEAAERFQVPLSTLNQKIKRLGIEIRRRGAGRDPADPLAEAAESRG
jgi:transcriptional regulator with GAF, ATPase, and Fis domain